MSNGDNSRNSGNLERNGNTTQNAIRNNVPAAAAHLGTSAHDANSTSATISNPAASFLQPAPDLTSPPTTATPKASKTRSMSSTASSSVSTTTPIASGLVVSQKTVEALGDWLLESASVHSSPADQGQRRKQSYKSSSLIKKTMKESQEERRKQALAEQAKKRYQFTNHARKLALFASGQPSGGSSDSESDDSQGEDDDDDNDNDDEDEDRDDEDDDDDEQDINAVTSGKKKRRSGKHSSAHAGENAQRLPALAQTQATTAHKRRLSSESESESVAGRKTDKAGDVLSPKKPRLQKTSPKAPRKKKDRNPFRDQLMIPEAMTDIPADLDANYYIVPLPIGHRCFVISADGKTSARLPTGQPLVSAFESCLPAGSSQYRGNRRSDYCILDCVYSSVTRTFWTLDIMCWRGHPVYECETEFRFWWLRGKLAEIEELQGKWITNQTKEWEQELAKKKQKRARQIKKRHEKAAAAAAASTGAMDVVPVETSDIAVQEEGDDGDDEAGTEGMDVEDHSRTSASQISASTKKFWPVVFTPLPYFNASVNLVRLLAESMHHQPTPLAPAKAFSDTRIIEGVEPSDSSATSLPLTGSTLTSLSRAAPITSFSSKSSARIAMQSDCNKSTSIYSTATLGTMALSGEIATAASLFPAHDSTQKRRQDQTLIQERAAGLVFFNKKTMYVLGTTPLCGWVAMDQIGDVFFGEEGGIGPVPGTSAVEGREVEMEDALERIRI